MSFDWFGKVTSIKFHCQVSCRLKNKWVMVSFNIAREIDIRQVAETLDTPVIEYFSSSALHLLSNIFFCPKSTHLHDLCPASNRSKCGNEPAKPRLRPPKSSSLSLIYRCEICPRGRWASPPSPRSQITCASHSGTSTFNDDAVSIPAVAQLFTAVSAPIYTHYVS